MRPPRLWPCAHLPPALRGATHALGSSIYSSPYTLPVHLRAEHSKHRSLLSEIAALLLSKVCASSHTVHIYKVRAHIGVHGNEQADAAAEHAAEYDDSGEDSPAAHAAAAAPAPPVVLFSEARHSTPLLGANWVQYMHARPTEANPDAVEYRNADTLKLQIKTQARLKHQNRIFGACPKARSAWQVPLGSPRLRVSKSRGKHIS
jgi:hypothetical protein